MSEAADALGSTGEPELPQTAVLDLIMAVRADLAPADLHAQLISHLARALPVRAAATVAYHAATGRQELHGGDAGIDWHMDERSVSRLAAGRLEVRSSGDGILAAIPALDGDDLRGWLVLAVPPDADPSGPETRRLLLAAGRLLGLVLGSSYHAEHARRGAEEAESIEAIAREMAESLEFDDVVERVTELAHRATGKPVVLWHCEDGRSRAVWRAGGAMVRLGEERDLPVSGADGSLRPDVLTEEGSPNARRILVPLAARGRVLAFMAVGPWADQPPEPEQLRLLRRLAPHAASALENAHLHAEVHRLSLTDPLVQLPNRRQLNLFLTREFGAALRGRPLCLALYDLDHFKDYNDQHGHRAGDEALIMFAEVLRREVRAMDLPARFGGEEFVVVLPNTEADGGRGHAERVRRALKEQSGGELTVSAGVAVWNEAMTEPGDLIAAADDALYRAKAAGRNRVHVAG